MMLLGVSILMFIFGIGLLIAGLVLVSGQNDQVLLWKVYEKNPSKKTIRTIGIGVLIASFVPFTISFVTFILSIIFGL